MIHPNPTHASIFLGFLGAATLVGCVQNGADAPMRIVGNVAPGEGCAVDSSSTTFNDDGVIEVASTYGYIFTPSVVNDITVIEGEAEAPKIIYVEGARVEIDFYDTVTFDPASFEPDLLKFQVPTSGIIDPGGGLNAFSFEIVPPELLAAIDAVLPPPVDGQPPPRTTLDVRVQMFGTKGGGDVESQVFRYPVEVCDGCLVSNVGACADLPSGFTASTGGACNVLQDGVLDCCTNASGIAVCPAVAPSGT